MLRIINRREWLSLGLFGLTAQARSRVAPSRSVLVLFCGGGQSQIDTWDPKPDAPEQVRGLFRPISTRTVGVRLCEHLPRLAAQTHRLAIVRSMSHDDLDHGSACYLALTGHYHARKSSNPVPQPTDQPTAGAIVRRLRPSGRLPYTAAHINGPLLAPELISAGQQAGFLGRAYDPLLVGDPEQIPMQSLAPQDELPPLRLSARRRLLESLERYRERLGDADEMRRQAHAVLENPAVRHAFDLSREPRALRERYGWHRSGQGCLLARRLIEAGVEYVVVFYHPSIRGQDKAPNDPNAYGWDTHNDIFEALRDHLLPRFDATFATLLEDLAQRGLLDSTLVVCMGEFGRAPLVALERNFAGSSPGRKHWAAAYSIAFAGAGIRGGQVIGATDRRGAYPTTTSYSPADVMATLFHVLGYSRDDHYHDALNRPYRLSEGQVMRELW
ncbi:MAG: DUF1501 domain-containing protein [Gemmataceae bacterium]